MAAIRILSLLAVVAAVYATDPEPPCPLTLCTSIIDSCSNTYGGCALATQCGGAEPTWPAPACDCKAPTYTVPPPPPVYVTPSPSPPGPSYCGHQTLTCPETTITYGGCHENPCHASPYAGCLPPPATYEIPSCPPPGTSYTPPPPPPPSYTTSSACSISWCIDNIDECGQMWGGCTLAPICGGPASPSFPKPPCTPTSVYPSPTAPPSVSSYPTSSACDITICWDGIDECGQGFGGCTLAPECGGPVSPSFSRPPCTSAPPEYMPPPPSYYYATTTTSPGY